MNITEFDHLMEGKPANWADALNLRHLQDVTDPKKANPPKLSLLKAEIEEKQTPIPTEISNAIQKFVQEERAKGETERAIRRAVQRKWNIYVV